MEILSDGAATVKQELDKTILEEIRNK